MAIFKENEIKKMLNNVQMEQMTFSRMVELLNQKIYKELAHKGQLISTIDVINTLEAFLIHNENIKNQTELKIKDFINYIKSEFTNL